MTSCLLECYQIKTGQNMLQSQIFIMKICNNNLFLISHLFHSLQSIRSVLLIWFETYGLNVKMLKLRIFVFSENVLAKREHIQHRSHSKATK